MIYNLYPSINVSKSINSNVINLVFCYHKILEYDIFINKNIDKKNIYHNIFIYHYQ
jgi:hypothetical protein